MKTGTFALTAVAVCTITSADASDHPQLDRKATIPMNPTYSYTFVAGCCIRSMIPVTATVTAKHFDRIFLKTPDGAKLSLGGIGVTPDITRFIASLSVGKTYSFPAALTDFEEAVGASFEEPTYDTAFAQYRQPIRP